ncbi:unnamed protein product [Durusdinium trenchii]|uniref:Ankyrin repeat domain-containing protein 50 n=3 Tax=Durusdinium trenchii TaxID=1381693 RepID=A0ABP0LYH6_9DINO
MDLLRPAGENEGQAGKLKKLFAEIEHGNQASVLERLREDFEGDCNCSDEGGTTPLLRAAALGQREIVQVLMEHKADLMASDLDGDNALMMAIAQNHLEIVHCLLDARDSVDPDVPNKIGQTPLMKAASKNNLECIEKLLELKVNVNATAKSGKTALIEAVEKKHVQAAQVLLTAGANPAAADCKGKTALFPAAFRCDEPLLRMLLLAKADPKATAEDVGTVLMMALDSMSFKLDAFKLLIEHGCPLDHANGLGETALMKAAVESNVEAVQALLEAHADVGKKNPEGQTAADLANSSVKELLQKSEAVIASKGYKQ